LVWKPERKRLLGKPKCRWEDNIRMALREIGWEGVRFIHLAQDRDQLRAIANTLMNLRVSYKAGNFLTSWLIISFSRWTLHHGVSQSSNVLLWIALRGYRRVHFFRWLLHVVNGKYTGSDTKKTRLAL
jgi:hypothetical protein